MPRPSILPMDVTKTGWVATLNSNFSIVLDSPFPIYRTASESSLSSINPALYADCVVLVQDVSKVYTSDGVSWALYDKVLDFVSDLSGSATLSDIITAYNSLLADFVAKGLMLSS